MDPEACRIESPFDSMGYCSDEKFVQLVSWTVAFGHGRIAEW